VSLVGTPVADGGAASPVPLDGVVVLGDVASGRGTEIPEHDDAAMTKAMDAANQRVRESVIHRVCHTPIRVRCGSAAAARP
jgi:hypothetical protein